MTLTAPDGAYTIGGGATNYGQAVSEDLIKSSFMFPTPTLDNMGEVLRMVLERLPLDALKSFQPFLGLTDDLFSNVADAVNGIIDSMGIRPVLQTVEMFAAWVLEFFEKLSGVFTGDIDVFVDWFQQSILSVFGWIPLSHIFPKAPNLLKFGGFDAELDLSPTDGWSWDPSVTASGTSSGSAKAVCDGSTKALMRQQTIFVEPRTKLNLSARVKSSGLTGSNAKIDLTVVEFHDEYMGDIVTVASRGASTNWATFGGDYEVPENITSVVVRLAVTEATAGTVWFDNLDLHRSGLLQMDWIAGLGDALDGAGDWFQNFIDGFFEALYGLPIIGATIEQIFTGVGDLVTDVEGVIGDLADLAWGLLNNAVEFLGQIPQALVNGLTVALGSIGTQATNAWNNVTSLAASLLAAPAAVVGSILNVVVDGVATMGQFLINLWQGLTGGTSTAARTAADVKTAGGSLLTAANAAQATANTANGAAGTAQTAANGAQTTANNAEAQAVANAAELAKLIAAEASSGKSGNSAFDNFDYVANPLTTNADWAVAGSGTGNVAVDGSKLYWADSGSSAGSRLLRFLKTKTVTPYQLVTMVWDAPKVEGPLGGGEAYTFIVARLNDAFTSYVYARIGYNSITFWKVIAGVGEYQIGNSMAYTPQVGDTVQFVVGNPETSDLRQFRIKVNGASIHTVTDGTGGAYGPQLSVVDAEGDANGVGATHLYKSAGAAFQASTRAGGGQTTPGAVSIFSLSDNKAAPLLGSVLRASRGTGTNGTVSSGDNIFPLGWFSNCDKTPDLTYDSNTGRVTASVEGTYQVKIVQDGNTAVVPGNGGQIRAILYKGVGAGARAVDQRDAPVPWTPSIGFNGFSGSFIVYLRAGEWIEPGYASTTAAAFGGNGSSGAGTFLIGGSQNTWFSVALLNRSYN